MATTTNIGALDENPLWHNLYKVFVRQAFPIVREKLSSIYSDEQIELALLNYFVRRFITPWLRSVETDEDSTLLPPSEIQWIVRNFQWKLPQRIQELQYSDAPRLSLSLFGDPMYDQLVALSRQLCRQADEIQCKKQQPIDTQEFYDEVIATVQQCYEKMTEYGRSLATDILHDIRGACFFICPSIPESPFMTRILNG